MFHSKNKLLLQSHYMRPVHTFPIGLCVHLVVTNACLLARPQPQTCMRWWFRSETAWVRRTRASVEQLLQDLTGTGEYDCHSQMNRIHGDICKKKGMNENRYLRNTRDVFKRFRIYLLQKDSISVFPTKIYSKPVKYISCAVKILMLIQSQMPVDCKFNLLKNNHIPLPAC